MLLPDTYKNWRYARFFRGVRIGCAMGIVVLGTVFQAGCLTRTSGPMLPYVEPATSIPNPHPDSATLHLSARIQDLQQELQRLRDMVERMQATQAGPADAATGKTLRNLQERVSFIERQLAIDSPPSVEGSQTPVPLTAPSQAQHRQPEQKPVQPGTHVQSAPAPEPAAAVEIRETPVSLEEKDFRDAYSAFRRGAYDESGALFEEFLKKHPKSKLTPDVVYWIGEARFSSGRFAEAVLQFDRVIKEFPGSKKELSALLKQGQAFEKMDDSRSAKIIFNKIVQEYPHTAQARIAAGRLKSLPPD